MDKKYTTSNEIRQALTGPCPSLRTPFKENGEIDYDSLANYLDFLLQAKAKNILMTHGDSLLSLLKDSEVFDLTKFVVEYVKGRAMVVAATDIWATAETSEFAEFCSNIGADMLMVLPCDWAFSCTVDTLVEHYKQAAKHIPVMLVTNYLGGGTLFGSRNQAFAFELFKRLYDEVPGVVSVKDDVCNLFARKLCITTNDRWSIISGGWKDNHMNMLPYGVDGFLSTFMSFKPEISWKYFNFIESGDTASAIEVIKQYDIPLREALTSGFNFDAAMHGVMEIFGIAKRYRRMPYSSLTDSEMNTLKQKLTDINLV